MRILINGRFLDKPVTGVERFGREITRAIAGLVERQDPAVHGMDFAIVRPLSDAAPFHPALPEIRHGSSRGQLWEQLYLPRVARGDVILNLCNMAPFAGRRNVVCVHDAHPWLIPDNFSWSFRRWYGVAIPRIIRASAAWTTVSRYSADKLVELGIADRMPDAVTYNAGDNFEAVDTEPSAAVPGAYVLCLGSRSTNKNIGMIAGIAPHLKAQGIQVVVAGGGNAKVFGAGPAAEPDVVNLGRVSDAELVGLYRNARAFLFPSLFEGFGVPGIEAMKFGCPVIASNSSALPEVLGDAAILLDPRNAEDWVKAILAVHRDDGLRSELIAKGRIRAARYSWTRSALDFVALARKAAQ